MKRQDLVKEISDARNNYHSQVARYDKMKSKRKHKDWSDENERNLNEMYVSLVENGQYLKGLKRGLEYVEALTK